MAFEFNMFGTPVSVTTGYEGMFETEEEKRRRLEREAAANAVVQTQKIKTYGDGSQTETVTKEIPAAATQPTQPVQPVQPQLSMAEQEQQRIMSERGLPAAPSAPAAPAVPQQQYNQYIAQNESGNRPDIGYHMPGKSTAYGPYGITAGAYQDARRANPALPADIAQATPEQMDQAQNAVTANNARYLQNYGVEPTQGNLALAHFLGAKGASDYLKSGYISPAAAAANGGEDRVRQIAQQRLAMGQAPVSGAAAPAQPPAPAAPVSPYSLATGQTGIGLQGPEGQMAAPAGALPTPGPGVQVAGAPGTAMPELNPVTLASQRYQSIQDDVPALLKMAYDDTVPEFLRKRASDRAAEINLNESLQQKYTQQIAGMTPREIANELSRDKEEGSWLKMLLLSYISPQLAGAEAAKLGFGKKWEDTTLTLPDGREVGVQIERAANGRVLRGTRTDGTPLTQEELQVAQTGAMPKGVHVTRVDNMIDPKNPNQIITKQVLSNGKERFLSGGQTFTGDKSGLQMATQFTEQENRRVNQAYSSLTKNYANPTQQQKAQALFDAGVSVYRIESELGLPPGALGTGKGRVSVAGEPTTEAKVAPSTNVNRMTPGQAQAVVQNPYERPVQREGEQNKHYDLRVKEWETKNKLQTKAAEAFAEKAYDIRNTLDKFQQGIEAINSGNHNLGPNFSISGAGPLPKVQQFFGEQFGTDDATNTNLLRSLITRDGLNGIKNSMGPAISNFDVETWMRSNPIKENSSPEAIKAWLEKTHRAMYDAAEAQRKNAERLGMIDPNFSLGSTPGTTQPAAGGAQIREGQTSTSKSGKPIIYRNGRWEYQ